MRVLGSVLLLSISFSVLAADRSEKIRILMDAQGLVQIFEQQRQYSREHTRKQSEQILDQSLSKLSPSKEFMNRFRGATAQFLKEVEAPWTAQDMVNVWAESYGVQFTDDELDQLIAFYASPLGKKEVAASRASLPHMNEHFAALSKPILEKAMQAYLARLKILAKECKCGK